VDVYLAINTPLKQKPQRGYAATETRNVSRKGAKAAKKRIFRLLCG